MRSFHAAGVMLGIAFLTCLAAAQAPPATAVAPLEPGLYAEIDTTVGKVECRLLPSEAPKTVENFVGLATGKKAWTDPSSGKEKHSPFYNGLIFHRVIKGFMIQAGDPLGTGEGGPGFAIDDEINPNLHFDQPGKLAMAKRSFPNSAGSQFFITTAAAPWLEGKYAIFGYVVSGQDVVDRISETPTDEEDKPTAPITIRKIAIHKVEAASAGAPPSSGGK